MNKIYNADCLEFMKGFPDKSIDLLLTDPPYGIGCCGDGYGLGVKPKILEQKNWDFSIPSEDYFKEMFRISKNQIIFGGNYFTEYLKPTKAWIIWDKIGNYKLNNNFSDCELIWTSFKQVTKKITFVQQGFINDDKTENKNRFHPTQKPLIVIINLLQMYSKEKDVILDCFSGSGTTAIACHRLKRHFICIEKDKDYYEKSVERLKKEKMKRSLI